MTAADLDRHRLALGIRQPWAELIVRGIKTIEVRSQDTKVRGTIYVYASRKLAGEPAAADACRQFDLDAERLPRGMIVGTVELHATAPVGSRDARRACVPAALLDGRYGWHLRRPVRFEEPLRVRFLPYGVWFYPFKRRNAGVRRR